MSVNVISSASVNAVTNVASTYVKQVMGGAGGTSTALQEATETPATTAKEAAKGDPVAKRLLARLQQEKQLQDPTPAEEPGKGGQLDQNA